MEEPLISTSRWYGGASNKVKGKSKKPRLSWGPDSRMVIAYNELLLKRTQASRAIKTLQETQNEYDKNYLKGGAVLKTLLDSSLCDCTSLEEPSDTCLVCNMPQTIKTTISSPKEVIECGSLYLVSDYDGQMVQLCGKNGEKINLFWCALANLVYLTAFLVKTGGPHPSGNDWNGSEVIIPLGRGIRVVHNWADEWIRIEDMIRKVVFCIDDFCDFETLYQYCQNFPYKLSDDTDTFLDKAFVPCTFISPFQGCNECSGINDIVKKSVVAGSSIGN